MINETLRSFYVSTVVGVILLCTGQVFSTDTTHSLITSDCTNVINWQWSVVTVEDPVYRTDTLVNRTPLSKEEAKKVVDKFCAKLEKELSRVSSATFFDNVTPVGRVVVTVSLKPRQNWSGASSANETRSERVADAVKGHYPLPLDDEDLNNSTKRRTKSKIKGYEISHATVRLLYPNGEVAATMSCPIDETGHLDIEQLAKQIAPDMTRIAVIARAK